jgi:O-methyltransferase involved in polyketide biosynthesis
LRFCATAAAGSRVVFTYVHRAVLDTPEAFAGTAALFAKLRQAGETWHFGLDPAEAVAYLRERGLELEDDVPASEYRARTFGAAAAARMRGYEFYRIAAARVPRRVAA